MAELGNIFFRVCQIRKVWCFAKLETAANRSRDPAVSHLFEQGPLTTEEQGLMEQLQEWWQMSTTSKDGDEWKLDTQHHSIKTNTVCYDKTIARFSRV
jgi:hypothetical protein